MLTDISSVAASNLYISGPLPLKLPVKKIFENFFITPKDPPFWLRLHFIAQNRENALADFKIQKPTQLLSKKNKIQRL